MQDFIHTMDDFSLISQDTPLISNLDMLENIALIKEFHELLPTVQAQQLANSYLQLINLEYIGLYRINECSTMEIFYVMFIRALMTKEKNIVILTPFVIVHSLKNIETMVTNMEILNKNNNKNIIILENRNNEIHYQGCACNIIK